MENKNFIITQQKGESIWDVALKAYDSYYGEEGNRLDIDSFDRNGWNTSEDEYETSPIKRTWLVLYLDENEYKALKLKSEANGGVFQFGYVNDTEDLYVYLKEVFSLD